VDLAQPVINRACFRPHQYLAREGEAQEEIYRIEEGWACRFRLLSDGRRQITSLFLPGDYCEPQWVLGCRPCQPIVALTAVRATRLPRPATGVDRGDQQRRLWLDLAVGLDRQADWLVSLGRRTAAERIAHLLCEIYERLDHHGLTYGQQCAMPLTQLDMADLTGLTSVHVNRTLQSMRAAGLVDLQSRWLRIPDLEALRAAASISPRLDSVH
jgi:CRP-like cAMP-binding protein